ncbi:MAG TPA: LytTR family transcriptional regulator DNA-binding domain-containing protein [Puia sp.]|nr:LytTR family transcriptional regulator DNA-binding domain-containing protein [Puia sp.]
MAPSSPGGFDWHLPIKGVHTMGALNCIVVEDNNKQSALLKEYIAKIPNLSFSARCESAADVYPLVTQYRANIIFWDIRLLDKRTMVRLRESGYYPIVIGIADKQEQDDTETDVFSFLYRPLSFERFLSTMNKIRDYLSTTIYIHHRNNRFVFVKSEYKIIKVKFEDILFCEGMKDYTQIYIKGRSEPILTLNNLKSFSFKLPSEEFIRVHRSYIVSLTHIDSIARNEIYIGKKIIPIGDSFKDDFYQIIEWNS